MNNNNIIPTKGNLMSLQRSLSLSKMGYELMDKKRNILIREIMQLIEQSKQVQRQIDETFSKAYLSLQRANITLGIIRGIANEVVLEDRVEIQYRSIMGVEIPIVKLDIEDEINQTYYNMRATNSALDEAFVNFIKVKRLCVMLAEIENCAFRLANAVKKTQKRANALKNIVIPNTAETIKYISDSLEEREREEFTRLKVIKNQKTKTDHA